MLSSFSTSLHQTRTSTSWVMSDPSSILSITEVDGTIGRRYDPEQQTTTIRCHTKFQCDLNTRKERSLLVAHEKAYRCLHDPDTLESVRVNDPFVAVTVDESFTTEQAVVGLIDEMHTLSTVRATPIVGYLSPSQICYTCALLRAKKLDMEMSPDTLEDFLTKVSVPWCQPTSSLPFSICPSPPRCFFFVENLFFYEFATNTGESSMSATPSLQSSCLSECVFVGLGDRVQHSSFCDFCILVIC